MGGGCRGVHTSLKHDTSENKGIVNYHCKWQWLNRSKYMMGVYMCEGVEEGTWGRIGAGA